MNATTLDLTPLVFLEIERGFEFGLVSHGDGSLYLRGQACIIALEPIGAKCALRYALCVMRVKNNGQCHTPRLRYYPAQ